jgi:hypothetical protein
VLFRQPTDKENEMKNRLLLYNLFITVLMISAIAMAGPSVVSAFGGFDSVGPVNNIKWQETALPDSLVWNSVTYGNGQFVAVAGTATNIYATSFDGKFWTQRTLPVTANWRSVVFGNGVFVATSWNSNISATSTDGITWTQQTLPETKFWWTLCFSNGLFTLGAANNLDTIYTSPDGIAWTQRTMPAFQQWTSTAYGNGLFVALGDNTSTGSNISAISTDGITWTQQTLPATAHWLGIAFGNGIFIATAQMGQLARSVDGITWDLVTPPTTLAGWKEVRFGDGSFVVSSTGTNRSTLFSVDGYSWIEMGTPPYDYWGALAYGGGTFVMMPYNSPLSYAAYLQIGVNAEQETGDYRQFRHPNDDNFKSRNFRN